MHQLLPTPLEDPDRELADEDLVQAYAYPEAASPSDCWVRANMVASADGAAGLDGRSGGLSGEGDRRVFGVLRGLADAVLVGAGTVRTEEYRPPAAAAQHAAHRRARGQLPAPVLAVVTARAEIDPEHLQPREGSSRPLVLTTTSADARRRAELATLADVVLVGRDRVDLSEALAALAARGLRRLLCEGGPTLLGQVVAGGLLDELCLTTAALLTGSPGPRLLDLDRYVGPVRLRIGHLLVDRDELLARYLVDRG
ncbi:MAG: dihydrofolate reductase family protein [Actinomycetes bacterium]